jgi:hypothetical protein
MSVAPPPKKRPTWNAETTVLPNANVSGSSSVACWLEVLVNGSLETCVSGTLADAALAPASATRAPTSHTNPRLAMLFPSRNAGACGASGTPTAATPSAAMVPAVPGARNPPDAGPVDPPPPSGRGCCGSRPASMDPPCRRLRGRPRASRSRGSWRRRRRQSGGWSGGSGAGRSHGPARAGGPADRWRTRTTMRSRIEAGMTSRAAPAIAAYDGPTRLRPAARR